VPVELQLSAVVVRTAIVLCSGCLEVAAAAGTVIHCATVLSIWLFGSTPCVLVAAVVQRDGLQLAPRCRRSRPLASLPAGGRCTCRLRRTRSGSKLHVMCSSAFTAGQLL
jgi:hypothetical protein